MVLCGVARCLAKKLYNLSSRLLGFFQPTFTVCTAVSANPLLEGRYGEHLTELFKLITGETASIVRHNGVG